MSLELVILGGGIKGAATAAIASLSADFNITLLERDRIGSGATSMNHGRLHLGTASLLDNEPSELVQRRRLGSDLMRQLPDVLVTDIAGLYCFEGLQEADEFQRKASDNNIPCHVADHSEPIGEWLDLLRYPRLFHVPEHAFNPARLAGRFAQTCLNEGGKVRTQQEVRTIAHDSNKLRIHLANGDILYADIVVNMLARWSSGIQLPPLAPQLTIKWQQWQLLCLHRAALPSFPPLDRVIVIMDNNHQLPSAIPHQDWITLDYKKTPVRSAPSPEIDDSKNWRPYDPDAAIEGVFIDKQNFDAVAGVFIPFTQFSPQELAPHLFSLTGVHGRHIDAPPGSTNKVHESPACPGYMVAFGGQASTSLLDALETIEHIRTSYKLEPQPRDQTLAKLQSQLAPNPIQDWMPMRWEQHKTV